MTMSTRTFHLLAAAIIACLVAAPSIAADDQKIALVIGNSAYPTAGLKNPVNDAKAMASKLSSLGFEVILRTDSTQREMTRAFSQFGQRLKGGSVGLFYYAGHGIQVRGKNFLIPVDAEIENEASTRSEAVDVDQLLDQLGPARLSIVILDACRNNPFERRFRGAGNGGLAQIDAPTGSLLAYATAPGKVAFDGTGVNGLYTTELLKALDVPGLKVEDLFKQVRINVLSASDSQQIPWESSSLTGEFFFRPPSGPQAGNFAALQSERERIRLVRELDEERKSRSKDAELVRAAMEKLRAELMKMRTETAATPVAATASPQAAVAPRIDIAIAPQASTAIRPPSAASAQEWTKRIALLEQSKDQWSFAKAIAILLDVSNQEDLEELVRFEKTLDQAAWSHAFALGVDDKGLPVWASGGRFADLPRASEEVLDICNRTAAGKCRLLVANRDVRQKEFLAIAEQFRKSDPASLRESLLASLKNRPLVTEVSNGMGGNGANGHGLTKIYSSQR